MQPGGTKYTLIPEEEEEEVAAAGCERDRKTSPAEDSSKKRKKVRGALGWPGKRAGESVLCSHICGLLQQCDYQKVAPLCAGSVAKQESPLQTF